VKTWEAGRSRRGPKVGRPSLSGKGTAARLEIKLSPADRARYVKAADKQGQTLSEWARAALEAASKR
jgi:uncharacterized protein (DUF1778 family)